MSLTMKHPGFHVMALVGIVEMIFKSFIQFAWYFDTEITQATNNDHQHFRTKYTRLFQENKILPALCFSKTPRLFHLPPGVLDRRVVWTRWCWWLCFRGAERGPKDRGCREFVESGCGKSLSQNKRAHKRGSRSSFFISGRKGNYLSSHIYAFLSIGISWRYVHDSSSESILMDMKLPIASSWKEVR